MCKNVNFYTISYLLRVIVETKKIRKSLAVTSCYESASYALPHNLVKPRHCWAKFELEYFVETHSIALDHRQYNAWTVGQSYESK